jgi:hypothetical protein
MRLFKQSDTSKVILFYMVDETDGYTEETGLSPAVTVSKNGAAFGAVSGTVAEVANGLYKLTPAAGDVDTLGPIVFRASAAGARACAVEGRVVAYDPYDAVRQGMTALPNAAADGAGGLPISDAGGLDLDAKLANTNEVTAARMGALTDLIDGGRLDLLIDGVKEKTDNLPASPAAVGSAMTLTSAYDAAKDDVLTPLAVVDGLVDTLIERLTALRAGYLDKLNVSGTLAHSDAAATYKATGFSTHSAADVKTAIEAAGSHLTLVKAKTDNLPASPAAVGSEMAINSTGVDAIWAKAMADLAAGAPSATASVLTAINYLFMAWRNKTTSTANTLTLYRDDGSTAAATSAISDNGTTFTKGEYA